MSSHASRNLERNCPQPPRDSPDSCEWISPQTQHGFRGNGCYCGSSALSHALLGGGNRFLRVLAQWIALSHAKDHENFLVEFPGHLIGNRGWGLARPFHEDGRKLRLANLATHENQQAFVASCLGEIRLIDILHHFTAAKSGCNPLLKLWMQQSPFLRPFQIKSRLACIAARRRSSNNFCVCVNVCAGDLPRALANRSTTGGCWRPSCKLLKVRKITGFQKLCHERGHHEKGHR